MRGGQAGHISNQEGGSWGPGSPGEMGPQGVQRPCGELPTMQIPGPHLHPLRQTLLS